MNKHAVIRYIDEGFDEYKKNIELKQGNNVFVFKLSESDGLVIVFDAASEIETAFELYVKERTQTHALVGYVDVFYTLPQPISWIRRLGRI